MKPEIPLPRLTPNHTLLSFISAKISLYVIAFMLPIIRNCLLYLHSCSTNSLNKEKGGFVTIMSACCNSSMHSLLLKSPSALKAETMPEL